MKKILLLMLLIAGKIGMAQNNGQAAENSVLRIEYITYTNGAYQVKITNKQTCAVKVDLNWITGSNTRQETVPANGSLTVTLASAFLTGKIKAKTNDFCGTAPDAGWVEIDVVGGTLPLKYKDFKVYYAPDGASIYVEFVPLESINVSHVNIQLFLKGQWKTVQVIKNEQLTINQKVKKQIIIW